MLGQRLYNMFGQRLYNMLGQRLYNMLGQRLYNMLSQRFLDEQSADGFASRNQRWPNENYSLRPNVGQTSTCYLFTPLRHTPSPSNLFATTPHFVLAYPSIFFATPPRFFFLYPSPAYTPSIFFAPLHLVFFTSLQHTPPPQFVRDPPSAFCLLYPSSAYPPQIFLLIDVIS